MLGENCYATCEYLLELRKSFSIRRTIQLKIGDRVCRMSLSLVSLNSFSAWLKDADLAASLSHNILYSWSKVDGYEVPLLWSELESFVESLEFLNTSLPKNCELLSFEAQKHILDLPILSFHLEDAKKIPASMQDCVGALLGRLHDALPHSYFVIHPDEVGEDVFQQLTSCLTQPNILTIENMDKRKLSHHDLKEVERLLTSNLKLGLTFDVCHWIESEYASHPILLLNFLNKFGSRIRGIHLSVPQSHFQGYKKSEPTNHHLCTESGFFIDHLVLSFLSFVPHEVAMVMEGFSPPACAELVEDEIDLFDAWSKGKFGCNASTHTAKHLTLYS